MRLLVCLIVGLELLSDVRISVGCAACALLCWPKSRTRKCVWWHKEYKEGKVAVRDIGVSGIIKTNREREKNNVWWHKEYNKEGKVA